MDYTRIEAATGKDKAALLRAVNLTVNSVRMHFHVNDTGAMQWYDVGAMGQIGHIFTMMCQVSPDTVIVDVIRGSHIGMTLINNYAGYPELP